jgi:secreted trypsin-like serine protease
MVSGWGVAGHLSPNSVMQKVSLPLYSQDKCASVFQGQTEIWRKQICIGDERGMNSCSGDSGDPLQAPAIYQGNPRYVQYGLASFGAKECASGAFPGIFTRLDYYLDWILDTMTV